MRITAIMAGMFLFCVIFLTSTDKVQALSVQSTEQEGISIINDPGLISLAEESIELKVLREASEEKNNEKEKLKTKKTAKKEPTTYVVKAGDSLSNIAKQHKTTWERLYYKNKNLSDPNIINPGEKIVIPESNEKLKEREIALPEPVPQPVAQASVASVPSAPVPQPVAATPAPAPAPAPSAGNTYYYGYCTYYAKSRRPDLPNNLGNADTWVARAAAQGIPTGSTPRVGAIGQQGMHVVFVEAVNGDGTVTISEMNFAGWGVVNQRTVPASSFLYIY